MSGIERRASGLVIEPASDVDAPAVVALARHRLGSERQVHSRRQFDVLDGVVLVARRGQSLLGFATLAIDGADCELLAIAVAEPGNGVGSALLLATERAAAEAGCESVRLVTTDANVDAQRFYERHGYRLRERRVGAVDWCREHLKPEIPENMHDELDYERVIR
jgi:ribosomal protein S18 acetylase RimI-like enzyme